MCAYSENMSHKFPPKQNNVDCAFELLYPDRIKAYLQSNITEKGCFNECQAKQSYPHVCICC